MGLKVYRTNYKYDRWKYLDPFIESEVKVHNNKWPKYLMSNYGLTPQQAWNIVHGLDKDYVGTCKYCGGVTRWTNHRGYSSTCMNKECRKRHDSERCTSTLNELWKSQEYRDSRHEVNRRNGLNMVKVAWSRPEFREMMSKHFSEKLREWGRNPITRAKGARATFLSRVKDGKECYFYVGWTWDGFKYGITTKFPYRPLTSGIISPHKLATGDKFYISELEFLVKLEFPGGLEYRPKDELSKFFKVFKRGVQRLSITGVHPLGMEMPCPESNDSGEDIV